MKSHLQKLTTFLLMAAVLFVSSVSFGAVTSPPFNQEPTIKTHDVIFATDFATRFAPVFVIAQAIDETVASTSSPSTARHIILIPTSNFERTFVTSIVIKRQDPGRQNTNILKLKLEKPLITPVSYAMLGNSKAYLHYASALPKNYAITKEKPVMSIDYSKTGYSCAYSCS